MHTWNLVVNQGRYESVCALQTSNISRPEALLVSVRLWPARRPINSSLEECVIPQLKGLPLEYGNVVQLGFLSNRDWCRVPHEFHK